MGPKRRRRESPGPHRFLPIFLRPSRSVETRGGPTLRGRALPDSELDVQAIAPGAEALDLIVEALFGDATGGALGGAHGRFQ